MKRLLCIILLTCLLYTPVQGEVIEVSAKGAVLLDMNTGVVLYGKEEDEQRSMASTTKIMTTLLLLEHLPPNQVITVTKEMVTVEGSSMGLLPGDQVTVEGLCYGMMLCSGNDAANVAAIAVAGSLEKFAEKMNQKATELMMNNTHFVTPSGLDDEHHYSTPYDMAILTAEALKNTTFAHIVSQSSAKVSYGNPPYKRTLTNHNRLLKSYEGCVGVKTGFTKKSGRCLVSAATRGDATLICVTLSAPNDWEDHTKLLDYGFSQMEQVTLPGQTVSLPVVGGVTNQITATAPDITLTVPSRIKGQLNTKLYGSHWLYAPVKQGQSVGQYVVKYAGKTVGQVAITAKQTVAYQPYVPPFWNRFWENIQRLLR